ncbi:hypothetical protein M0802_014662 [Mischocyttarus mexicanus]|nr:hypothetical protein M0802_016076 [Mischocyttarus mexicanus]KAI4477786.1 hypothetical protein M0802_014662 [Mischocyttarus mexicanus]
MLIALAY